MPSARRLRLLLVAVMAVVITTLFFTSKMRQNTVQDTRTIQDFYHKTMNAIDHHPVGQKAADSPDTVIEPHIKDKDGDGTVDEDDIQLAREMSERLRAAEQKAKDLANKKAPLKPDHPDEVVGVGSSADGQHPKSPEALQNKENDESRSEGSVVDTEVDEAMDRILKKSPIIIFSKSYCPYSKRAKAILLTKYTIDPPPYVVELDEHPLGAKLQAKLGRMTGRKTVPNIMVNYKSVGGSDEVADLHQRKTLVDKFKSLTSNRVVMKERFDSASDDS
ncbi:glutaredoxin [Microdochium trichocladiopsis]|uniref:Glutaredoxin n=1 Tax=Microdochium trichocladiopsis TaxID=1682393 RepID=A0A9P8Y385_9PEZI|nr:glutaredoxin [Microdochium trichocladiopsis]KAH7026377.1 glutaredoxin [Microdochium trichocladiopsis]